MTVDLLSVKLKEAKRELTNLKTAHSRGLGMLKLYTFTVNMDTPSTGFWDIILTINFKYGQSPFPFVEAIPIESSDTSNVIDLVGANFSPDGMSFILQFAWLASDPPVNTVNIFSTSEINDCNVEWVS